MEWQYYLHYDIDNPDQGPVFNRSLVLLTQYSAVVHYVHFYRTRDTAALYSILDNHSRYRSLIFIISLMIQIQYLTDHIMKLNTVEMGPLRSWTEVDTTWQSLCRILIKIRPHKVCSEQLFGAGIRLLTEFSKYKFGGQLRPTNTVARRTFRAIGPMELLRPAHIFWACDYLSMLPLKAMLVRGVIWHHYWSTRNLIIPWWP